MNEATTYPKRTRTVCNYIRKHREVSDDLELIHGDGYWYFDGESVRGWFATSVMVFHLGDLTLDKWLAEYDYLKAHRGTHGVAIS